MVRVFDAPAALVFRAFTDRDLIPRWWGPARYTTTIHTLDLRPGGLWRFIQQDAEGNEYVFYGEYRQVDRPTRLVYTFEWDGMPGHVMVDDVTFEESGGRTRVTIRSSYPSVEDRDGMLEQGAQDGADEGNDRLDTLLAELVRASN